MIIEQALVVPFIIGVTQLIKPVKKYYKLHGIIAFLLSIVGTVLVALYNLDREAFYAMDAYSIMKFSVENLFLAVTTWLSSSKLYDMVHGSKKKDEKFKEQLETALLGNIDADH